MMSSLPPEEHTPEPIPWGIPVGPPLARAIPVSEFGSTPPSDPMLLREIGRKAAGIDLLVFVAVILVVVGAVLGAQFAAGPAADSDSGAPAEQDDRALDLGLTVVIGVLAMALAIAINRRRGLGLPAMGLTWWKWQLNLAVGLATTVAAFAVFLCVNLVIQQVWPTGYEELLSNAERVREQMPEMGSGAIVALTVFVGVWEEVVFRGFLLPRLRRLTDFWVVAVVLSSAVFAILHLGMQTPVIVVPLFFIGVLFCVVTIWRRSLIPAIVGHFLFDLIAFLVINTR